MRIHKISDTSIILLIFSFMFLYHISLRIAGAQESYFHSSPIILIGLFYILLLSFLLRIKFNIGYTKQLLFFLVWIPVVILSAVKGYQGPVRLFYSIVYPALWLMIYDFVSRYSDSKVLQHYFNYFSVFSIICIYIIIINSSILNSIQQNDIYIVVSILPWIFSRKRGVYKFLLLIISFLLIAFSLKRGAFAASGIGLLTYILFVYKWNFKSIFLFFFAIFILFWISVKMNLHNYLIILERLQNLSEDQGSGRIKIYNQVISDLQNFGIMDWIFGKGYLSVQENIPLEVSAHNDFLEVLYDFGILGLTVYLALIFSMVFRIRKYKMLNRNIYAAFVSSVTIFLSISMYSHLIIYVGYTFVIIIFWAYCERLWRKKALEN